jgi:hypothetical protein
MCTVGPVSEYMVSCVKMIKQRLTEIRFYEFRKFGDGYTKVSELYIKEFFPAEIGLQVWPPEAQNGG